MRFRFEERQREFAAEVVGLDIREALTAAEAAAIEAASLRWPVLVYRGQQASDAEQAAFSAHFGDLQRATGYTQGPSRGRLDASMTDASNIGADDRTFQAGDRRRMNLLGSRRWHTDGSYKDIPAKYSFLSCRVAPEVGGETQFADLRAAYDALPAPLKALIEALELEHDLAHSRAVCGFPDAELTDRDALPPARHRLVRVQPETGRRSLYISSHAKCVIGWPAPESVDLLRELTERATQPAHVHTHRWATGDLVQWDNRVTMHRALRHYPETAPRDMRRTTVYDGGALAADKVA
jgi:alpha-ketoglutarate-dependent 2,4-dichlorophenoxyacetate dioxygenase